MEKTDDENNVDERFKALVQEGFKCMFCQKCVSERPCDPSLVYCRNKNLCPWCALDLRTRKRGGRNQHIGRCKASLGNLSASACLVTHNKQFSIEMADGKIDREILEAAGLAVRSPPDTSRGRAGW
jgi:hypothetical protein